MELQDLIKLLEELKIEALAKEEKEFYSNTSSYYEGQAVAYTKVLNFLKLL